MRARKRVTPLIKFGPATSLYLVGCAIYGMYHTALFIIHGAF